MECQTLPHISSYIKYREKFSIYFRATIKNNKLTTTTSLLREWKVSQQCLFFVKFMVKVWNLNFSWNFIKKNILQWKIIMTLKNLLLTTKELDVKLNNTLKYTREWARQRLNFWPLHASQKTKINIFLQLFFQFHVINTTENCNREQNKKYFFKTIQKKIFTKHKQQDILEFYNLMFSFFCHMTISFAIIYPVELSNPWRWVFHFSTSQKLKKEQFNCFRCRFLRVRSQISETNIDDFIAWWFTTCYFMEFLADWYLNNALTVTNDLNDE